MIPNAAPYDGREAVEHMLARFGSEPSVSAVGVSAIRARFSPIDGCGDRDRAYAKRRWRSRWRWTPSSSRSTAAQTHSPSISSWHSSCSNSSSAVASWYCWYSDTRSFMLLSASVNSISSMPSPVYQCKKALRRNIAENCSEMRLNSSWMAVVLPMNVDDILRPFGGISQTAHLLVDLLHRHAATEDGGDRQVAAVARIARGHHVLGVEHLLRQLRHGQRTVLLRAAGRQRGEAGHEEVETRERHHVDGQLAQIGVQLTREPQAGGDAGHRQRDEMVQVALGFGTFSVRKQMSYRASLSMQYVSSVFSTSWWIDRVALYGSTTVSDTFGDGTTEYVFMMRSGYSSRIFEMSSVPMPEPVPPPSECVNWNP
uniref:Uncharacterized protein n=1 Tax=Anopheles atroparvus TaxID=41427 RepID=A0A182J331_ANOAO